MASSNNEVLKWPVSVHWKENCVDEILMVKPCLVLDGIKILTTIKQKDIVIFLLQKILTA